MINDDKSRITVKAGDNDGVILSIPFESTVIIKRKGHFMQYTMLIHNKEEPLEEKLRFLTQKGVLLFMYMARTARKNATVTLTAVDASVYLKVQKKHVYEFFTELKGIDLIRRVVKDVYQVNPSYVWWGPTADWSLAVSDWKAGLVRHEVVEIAKIPDARVRVKESARRWQSMVNQSLSAMDTMDKEGIKKT